MHTSTFGSMIQWYAQLGESDHQAFSWLNEDMKTLRRDFLPSDLRPLLRSYGMDGTIAVQARQCEEETQFLLDLAESNEDVIMGVVGWVDLRADNVEERVHLLFPSQV